jgi:hypothetical protein
MSAWRLVGSSDTRGDGGELGGQRRLRGVAARNKKVGPVLHVKECSGEQNVTNVF